MGTSPNIRHKFLGLFTELYKNFLAICLRNYSEFHRESPAEISLRDSPGIHPKISPRIPSEFFQKFLQDFSQRFAVRIHVERAIEFRIQKLLQKCFKEFLQGFPSEVRPWFPPEIAPKIMLRIPSLRIPKLSSARILLGIC